MSSENEAFREAYSIIDTWKPPSDVFAIKHFAYATGTLSGISGAYINSHYRKVVKLRSKVLIPTTIPIVFLPVLVSTLMHHQFVQHPLILQKFQCPVCIELRAGAVQFLAGFFYPMVLAPVACFHFASTLYTYNLPTIKEPKKLWEIFVKLTRPALSRFSVLAGLQVFGGMALTHAEAYNLFTVLSKLSMMESELQDTEKYQEKFRTTL